MAMRMSEEEYADLQTKIANEKAEQEARNNQNKPPEAQTQTPPAEEKPPGLLKRTMNRMSQVADVAVTDITGKTKKERDLINETKRIERERAAEKAKEKAMEESKEESKDELKEELKPSSKKKGKKGKHKSLDDMFDDMDDKDFESPRSREGRPSPVGTYESAYQHNKPVPYESAYAGKNVMGGQFQEAYIGKGMANGVYKSPGNPRTYEHTIPPRPPQPTPQPMKRAPIVMPTVGSFGRGNVKMPTISIGGYGPVPKVAGAHKMGPGNMPSINIPTLGGSTLMMGSSLMKKTANNKIGVGKFDIPTIGNWGKAPLKSKLETPSIGNLTIMGAGKGGVKFGLGEIPRFGLAAPGKRKK